MIRNSRKYVFGGALSFVLILAAIVASAAIKTLDLHERRDARFKENSKGPVVLVTSVQKAPIIREVTLIGESRSYLESTLYAKVSGYLKSIAVDKGDRVKEGQQVATIESPETDKSYVSALADYTNKHRIARRYRVLLKKKLVSPQEAEGAFANEEISLAYLQTQETLRNYEKVFIPFSGRVTARYVDPGALIQQATGSQAGAQAVITVSQTDRLRIYVYVDQRDAPYVKPGTPVTISFNEQTGEKIDAKVSRVSGTLDPRTRTLLTEIDLLNDAERIVPGSYVSVTLSVPEEPSLGIPARSLVMEGDKPFVAVVDDQSKVHYVPVKVVSNDGELVRIENGLREGERIAVSLGTTVSDGQRIQIRELDEQRQQAGIVLKKD